jgi:hypothetical protein
VILIRESQATPQRSHGYAQSITAPLISQRGARAACDNTVDTAPQLGDKLREQALIELVAPYCSCAAAQSSTAALDPSEIQMFTAASARSLQKNARTIDSLTQVFKCDLRFNCG